MDTSLDGGRISCGREEEEKDEKEGEKEKEREEEEEGNSRRGALLG